MKRITICLFTIMFVFFNCIGTIAFADRLVGENTYPSISLSVVSIDSNRWAKIRVKLNTNEKFYYHEWMDYEEFDVYEKSYNLGHIGISFCLNPNIFNIQTAYLSSDTAEQCDSSGSHNYYPYGEYNYNADTGGCVFGYLKSTNSSKIFSNPGYLFDVNVQIRSEFLVSKIPRNAISSIHCTLSFEEIYSVNGYCKEFLETTYTSDGSGDYNLNVWSDNSFDSNIYIEQLYLNKNSLTLNKGERHLLQARYTPVNATKKNITWSSSNSSVVTVDSNGIVTAKAGGRAVITAKSSSGKSVSCVVVVKKQSVIDYDNYKYNFDNSYDSFGYDDTFGYVIPQERYLQAGIPKSKADQYMHSLWDGSCYGMSMSSILFYKNVLQEERYNSEVQYPIYFDSPDTQNTNDKKLRQMIELFQVSQFLGLRGWMVDNEDFAPAIAEQLDQGNPGILGMYNDDGGHAVVIYGYSKTGNTYIFNIYDCSNFVTKLVYTNKDNWYFDNNEEGWAPEWFQIYGSLESNFGGICENNGNNVISLFSVSSEKNVYITCATSDFTVINSNGIVSEVKNGKLSGEIPNIRLIPSGYLAEKQIYTIIAPTDTYTIFGNSDDVITTSFADDYMSASVTAKSSTPITISSDLEEISVDTAENEEYSIQYTTYDNIFDEMILSGVAAGKVTSKLNDGEVGVTGVNTLTANVSVSDEIVSTSSEGLTECDNITVKCEETDTGTTIQILNAGAELTEKTALPERLAVDAPTYDLESGTYTEGQVLTFEKDSDTIIYYTTDGSIPSDDNGIIYSMPIEINKSMTIKAISTKYGYLDSEVIELNYTLPEVNMPQASIESGEYDKVISVELSTGNYDDEIYYTLDGSDPLENGMLYTVPINISEDAYLQAYTLRNGCISEINEYDYVVSSVYPFYFSNTLTNQDGEIITSDNIAELTKVKATVSKLHTGECEGVFAIAFYDADDRLIYVKYKSETISDDLDEVEIEITDNVSSACKVKVFAWKDLLNMEPMCESIEEIISVE